jgi:hypothetical protein
LLYPLFIAFVGVRCLEVLQQKQILAQVPTPAPDFAAYRFGEAFDDSQTKART